MAFVFEGYVKGKKKRDIMQLIGKMGEYDYFCDKCGEAYYYYELTEEHICNYIRKRNYNRSALIGVAELPPENYVINFFELHHNCNLTTLGSYLLSFLNTRQKVHYFMLGVMTGETYPPYFFDSNNDEYYTAHGKKEVTDFATKNGYDFVYLHDNNNGWIYCVPKNNSKVWRKLNKDVKL